MSFQNNAESDSSSAIGSIVGSISTLSDNDIEDSINDPHPQEEKHHKSFSESSNISGQNAETLCPCTDLTVSDIVFMVLSLGVRHSLTWDAQVDVIKLIGGIFKNKNIPVSKYLYFKYLGVKNLPITFQSFCNECDSYLGERSAMKDVKKCPACEAEMVVNSPSNTFVTISLASQLQSFLKDEDFVKNVISHRFQPQAEKQYRDIYDGAIYKSLSKENGILSNPLNFSYTFFVDGMKFGQSSDKTIWPIYLTINELPYEERSKYLLLSGLYVGCSEPNLEMYLTPFVSEANILSSEGVQWVHNHKQVVSKVIPLCCVADSVARCKLMNFQSFHATYGCTFCYKESVHSTKGQKYAIGEPAALRTDESLIEDLHQVYLKRDLARDEDRVHRGVKGVSPLHKLSYFSMTKGFVVDYMHCILLGVTKAHMEILFEARNKKMWYRVNNERVATKYLVSLVDSRIKKIQSNSSIIRELRPIKVMAQWKASEFRSWLLFYCIPCLQDLLKVQYLSHLSLLSKATYLLLQKTISHSDVEEAQRILVTYSFYYQKYFGLENMTYNVHLLSHIAHGVFNFGPVVGHNSFVYEAQNRYIGQMCKSPFAVVYQVARKFLVFRSLPTLCTKFVTSQEAMFFSEQILNYKKLKKCFKPLEGCALLGTGTICPLSQDEQNALLQYGNVPYYEKCYQRMIFEGSLYCTSTYCESFQNNDSCVLMKNGDVVLIKHILRLTSNEIVVLADKLQILKKPCVGNNYTKINHIKIAKQCGIVSCASVKDISRPCFLMMSPSEEYVFSPIPYGCSVE